MLVIDPMDCKKCDITVCGKCTRKLRNKCPQRCSEGFKTGHKLIKLILNRVIVMCPNKLKYSNKTNVCEAVLPLPEMLEHL